MNIALVNQSQTFALGQDLVDALNADLNGQFATDWGLRPTTLALAAAIPTDGSAYLVLQDDADVDGALGYHDKDSSGNPFAKVFVNPSVQAGVDVATVICHELKELRADPEVDLVVVQDNGDGTGTVYAAEACDPCQDLSYQVNGFNMSDHITPAWFEPENATGPFDATGGISAPLTKTAGGYFLSRAVTFGGDWQQNGRSFEGPKG